MPTDDTASRLDELLEAAKHVRPEVILALADQIRPILAGHPPMVQGAILAELLSMWLAGHIADTSTRTKKLRKTLLDHHVEHVRKLTEVNHMIIHGR